MSQESPTDRLTSVSTELEDKDAGNIGVELLLARKNQRFADEEADDPNPYKFGFVNTDDAMADHLVNLVADEVQSVVDELEDEEEELSTTEYDIANKNRDKDLVQHLPFEDIEQSDRFEPIVDGTVNESDSFDTHYDLSFVAIRLLLPSDTTLVAFQTFSKGQVLKTEESLLLSTIQERTGGENNEPVYKAEVEDTFYQLPYRVDALYIDDTEIVNVFNQQRFERIFDYYDEFRDAAEEVVTELEDMDIPISGMEYIETGYQHFPNAARLFYDVRELGRYRNLDQKNLEYLYENFSPDPIVQENGEYQIEATDRFDVWGVLRVLNDSHLESPVTDSRYVSHSKQESSDGDTE